VRHAVRDTDYPNHADIATKGMSVGRR